MSLAETHAEQIARIYDAFARGDFDSVRSELDPQVEWVNPEDAVEPGTRHGPGAFVAGMRRLHEMFTYSGAEIVELLDHGADAVVAVVRFTARGRGSDLPIDLEFAHVLHWRDRKVTRLEWFRTRADALAAG